VCLKGDDVEKEVKSGKGKILDDEIERVVIGILDARDRDASDLQRHIINSNLQTLENLSTPYQPK
jgi:hypothetical protein